MSTVKIEIELEGNLEGLLEASAEVRGVLAGKAPLVRSIFRISGSIEVNDEISYGVIDTPAMDTPIEAFLPSGKFERAYNCLKRRQINTLGELLAKTDDDLLAITNFGMKSLDEVKAVLAGLGLSLKESRPRY